MVVCEPENSSLRLLRRRVFDVWPRGPVTKTFDQRAANELRASTTEDSQKGWAISPSLARNKWSATGSGLNVNQRARHKLLPRTADCVHRLRLAVKKNGI